VPKGVGSQVAVLDAILFQTGGRLCPAWHNRLKQPEAAA